MEEEALVAEEEEVALKAAATDLGEVEVLEEEVEEDVKTCTKKTSN